MWWGKRVQSTAGREEGGRCVGSPLHTNTSSPLPPPCHPQVCLFLGPTAAAPSALPCPTARRREGSRTRRPISRPWPRQRWRWRCPARCHRQPLKAGHKCGEHAQARGALGRRPGPAGRRAVGRLLTRMGRTGVCAGGGGRAITWQGGGGGRTGVQGRVHHAGRFSGAAHKYAMPQSP